MNNNLLFIILLFVGINVLLLVVQETDAKSFYDIFFDRRHRGYENSYGPNSYGPAPQPVGGKERYKQICNIQRGIGSCY